MALFIQFTEIAGGLLTGAWSTADISTIKGMLEANEKGQINIANYWAVGQSRTVNYTATVYGTSSSQWTLTDLNGTSSGGTKYNAVIHTKNLFATSVTMSSSSSYRWDTSLMRTTVMPAILAKIPTNFKALFKSGKHKFAREGNGESVATSTDTLFLFSRKEVNSGEDHSEDNACKVFKYFETAANRKKTGSKNGDRDNTWWLRTCGYNGRPCYILPNGGRREDYGNTYRYGICCAALI